MVNYIGHGLKTKLILPFGIPGEDRKKAPTENMKIAAIFYLAEAYRKKGEGHILKKTDEKLIFLAEGRYPIWLIPYKSATLLFDGLGVSSYTFAYNKIPDVKAFNKNIQRKAKTWQMYLTALSRNANYFKNFVGTEEKTIKGLITSTEFIEDFSLYSSSIEKIEKPETGKVVLNPIFSKTDISGSIKELANLKVRINNDIKNLEASMKLLSSTTGKKVKAIRKEIQKIRKKFDKKIEKAKPRVAKKTQRIQDNFDKKIKVSSKRFDKKIQLLYKGQVKVEKTQKCLINEIKRCEKKIKSCKRRKDKRNLDQWTVKFEKVRKKLPTLKEKIKKIDTKIQKLAFAKNLEISKIEKECDKRIEASKKIIMDLEASREARVRIIEPKITATEETQSMIIGQINEMVMSKKEALTNFDKITMLKKRRSLVYLPFYVVRYNLYSKKRYDIYPPSIVNGMGMSAKLKGVFGIKKMKCFLEPRSKAITLFLNQLVPLIQKNPMLEKEFTEAGIQASALRTKKLRLGVKRGLNELKEEKWISEHEVQILSKLLYLHTPSSHLHKRIKIKLKASSQN